MMRIEGEMFQPLRDSFQDAITLSQLYKKKTKRERERERDILKKREKSRKEFFKK